VNFIVINDLLIEQEENEQALSRDKAAISGESIAI